MNEQQQELYEKLLKKVNEFCLGQAAEDVIAAIDDLVDSYECTGQTPSEALNAIKEQMPKYMEEAEIYITKTEIRSIEKSIEALEIIKKRECIYDGLSRTTQEEYNLLMEVLK